MIIRPGNSNKNPSACVTIPANVMKRLRLEIGDAVDFDIENEVAARIVVLYRKSDFKDKKQKK